ncbi:hypothetical protein NL676_017692 [Syzygium grande]|nr:hypothetical protein NL676_017692 [Syzygium grande]
MKLKARCFVALVFATVLVSSAAIETSEDEKKCISDSFSFWGKDKKEAKTVTEKNQAAKGATSEDVVHDEATGQYMPAHSGRGWGGGGHGGSGGGHGGGGRGWGGGGGRSGGGGGGKCPHCTAAAAHKRARAGKP